MSGALHPLDFSMTIKDNIDNKGNTTFIAMITGAKRFGPQKSCDLSRRALCAHRALSKVLSVLPLSRRTIIVRFGKSMSSHRRSQASLTEARFLAGRVAMQRCAM